MNIFTLIHFVDMHNVYSGSEGQGDENPGGKGGGKTTGRGKGDGKSTGGGKSESSKVTGTEKNWGKNANILQEEKHKEAD